MVFIQNIEKHSKTKIFIEISNGSNSHEKIGFALFDSGPRSPYGTVGFFMISSLIMLKPTFQKEERLRK